MADNENKDAFDEFLDRAEEDMEEEESDDILDDVEDDDAALEEEDEGIEGASLSGAIVSDEMRAQFKRIIEY